MLPFTYLFKGVYEFKLGNYEVAVEHFQNSTKFYHYHNHLLKEDKISKLKPNFPRLEDSVAISNRPERMKFDQLFGIYGEHKYTVTVW